MAVRRKKSGTKARRFAATGWCMSPDVFDAFYASGIGDPVAMSITGHADRSVLGRYNCQRDEVQADALARTSAYPAT